MANASDPYVELLRLILDEQGIEIPIEYIESAAATHDKLHHEFEKLRSVDLSYVPPYIEPATGLRWIESYGLKKDSS